MDKNPVEKIEQRETTCDKERQTNVVFAEYSAEGRTENETDAEAGPEFAEGGSAVRLISHVGNVGLSNGDVSGEHAAQDS